MMNLDSMYVFINCNYSKEKDTEEFNRKKVSGGDDSFGVYKIKNQTRWCLMPPGLSGAVGHMCIHVDSCVVCL